MRVCQITGARPSRGHTIHRRGLAKKQGGVGRHVTAMTKRSFYPNLRRKRIWVSELNKFVEVRCTARALKTMALKGTYATLKKAGLVD